MRTIYSIDQVAEILKLHPKTVGAYVRSGRIKAVKTGKQWLIAEDALDSFMQLDGGISSSGGQETCSMTETPPLLPLSVSTVVDIAVESEHEAFRLSTTIFAVLQSESANGYRDNPQRRISPRCDYTFFPETKRARFMLWGDIDFITGMLKSIQNFI